MTMLGGGPQVEVVSAPALAELARHLAALPRYMLDGRPFAVEPHLWKLARDEMKSVMRDRGWQVAVANIDRPNFLFKGVPIVMGD